MRAFVISIIIIFTEAQLPAFSAEFAACPDLYSSFSSQFSQPLAQKQEQFLQDTLYPVLGKRLFSKENAPRPCLARAENCLIFPESRQSKEIKIEWTQELGNTPRIEAEKDARVLKIPQEADFQKLPEQGRLLIQKLFIGHELHPFIAPPAVQVERMALGEEAIFLKDSQKEAIEALSKADLEGKRKHLLVSPSAWGKTTVLKALMEQRLKNGSGNLHIILADQNHLSQHLAAEIKNLNAPKRVVFWGEMGEKAGNIEDLVREAKAEPIVLVSTVQSLKSALKQDGWSEGIQKLRSNLNTLVYDEAQHIGAPEAKALIEGLIDAPGSKASLFGLTATPTHKRLGIQQFFSDSAYWAYLDQGESIRPVDQVVEQLSAGIQRGEITPLEHTYFITPESLQTDKNLFIKDGSQKFILSPENYSALFKRIQPLFENHKNGFITVGTIKEANSIAAYLNSLNFGKNFAVLNSSLSATERDSLIKNYAEGKINYLIAVKYLDEGVRYPGMSLYVDLNRNVGATQFLQRIGGVLALEQGKDHVDIASLVELDAAGVKEHITLIDKILEGKFEITHAKPESTKSKQNSVLSNPEAYRLSAEESKAELVKLRAQLKKFWDSNQIRESEKVALATIAFAEKFGVLPNAKFGRALNEDFLKFYSDPNFQGKLKENPKVWQVFQDWLASRPLISPQESAAIDTIAYILREGSIPQGKIDAGLYNRFLAYKNDPRFQAKLRENAQAWELFQSWLKERNPNLAPQNPSLRE